MPRNSIHRWLSLWHKTGCSIRACLFVFAYLLGCAHVSASTRVDYDYYEIYASDAGEVLAQIASKGSNGFAAHTDWAISYQYTTSQRSGTCQLVSTDVSLSIEYLLPQWKNEVFADLALQSRWRGWYKNLVAHEEQHGAHGEAAYASINSQFDRLDSEPSCDDLSAKLANIVDQVIAEHNEFDSEFDVLTQHGSTQGAAQIDLLTEEDRVPAIAAALEADDMGLVKKIFLLLGSLILLIWVKRRILG